MKTKSFNALYYLFDILNNDELLKHYRLSAKILGSKVEKSMSGKDNSACSG